MTAKLRAFPMLNDSTRSTSRHYTTLIDDISITGSQRRPVMAKEGKGGKGDKGGVQVSRAPAVPDKNKFQV